MTVPLTALDSRLFGYRLVLDDGTELPERPTLNFQAPLLATDDSGNRRTNVRIPAASSGGSGIVPATTATTLLTADGAGALVWAKLSDAYVDAAAAIAGTKVAPNFGAQDIVTTGNLSLGASPATGGDMRVDTAFKLWALSTGAGNCPIMTLAANGNDVDITIGANNVHMANVSIAVPTGQTIGLGVSGSNVVTVASALVTIAQSLTIADTFNLTMAASGSGAIVHGSDPAATGDFRASSGWTLAGKDAAGAGEADLIQWTAGDVLQLGDNDADLEGVTVAVPTGKAVELTAAGAAVLSCTDDEVTLAATVLEPHTGGETIAAGTGITSAMLDRSYLRIRGDGGNVDITANPQIAAGTDGQVLILQGTDDAATVKLDDGTGLALSASHTLAENDTLTLIYDSGEAVWIEISQTTVT